MKLANLLCLLALGTNFSSFAQENASDSNTHSISIKTKHDIPIGKPYWGNSLDALVFSTALIDKIGTKSLGTLRFSAFFHIGATYNYNVSKNFGMYTGLDIKNIGYIEKFSTNNATLKQRVYTLGLPVGLRFGNMYDRSYFFLGGGLDVAFHYKSKFWADNVSKTKFNEWFSDKSELLLPYMFAGVAMKGTTIKIQYYPSNFTPTALNKVNLLLFSIGRDMKFGKIK